MSGVLLLLLHALWLDSKSIYLTTTFTFSWAANNFNLYRHFS